MKKIYLILALFIAGTILGCILHRKSSNNERTRFESFLKKEYAKVPRKEKINEKEPAADQPEAAAMQDFFMTVDPRTGKIPRERRLAAYQATKAQSALKSTYDALSWQGYEADMGGRTRAIMFDPNDPNHKKVWAGGITGGLWYNTDLSNANSAWVPVGDFWSDLAIRCITYDPNHPSVFYLGTGEAETAMQTYRESSGLGDGIWKSTDGGQTWNVIPSTAGFAYVTDIQVRNESGNSVIYAGVASGLYQGQQHTSQPSDGLFRSTDGGTSWQQVLPDITGQTVPYAVSDIAIGADGRIYVGTRPNLNGNGGAVILWSDSGVPGTWSVDETFQAEILADPQYNIPGRVVLATAPSDANVIYALIASGFLNPVNNFNYFYCLHILRSDNKGATWTKKTNLPDPNGQNNFAYIAWHALDIAVDPNATDNVFVGGLDMHKSTNGGNSWSRVSDWSLMYGGGGPQYIHADQHIIQFKPGSSTEMVFGSDGGIFYTSNGTSSQPTFQERNKNYTTLQFYSAAISPTAGTDKFVGGLQDNGSLYYNGNPLTIFDMLSGGDGAYAFYDENEPNYSMTSIYYNVYYVWFNGSFSNYMGDWQSGVFVNPADLDYKSNTLYANAVDFIGTHMDMMLRLNNIYSSAYGTFVPLNTGSEVYFSAVRYSPFSPAGESTIFMGTQSGRLFKFNHAEGTPVKTEITGADFPTANISSIAIGGSEDTLMVTFSNYGVPSVWQTQDGGATWQDKEGNLPDMPIRWGLYHPDNSNYALLATETGVWSTANLNAVNPVWTPDNSGLANVRTDMLTIRKADNTVLAATHGRGLFTTTWDISTGINDRSMPAFSLYPNPTRGSISMKFPQQTPSNAEIRIYDQNGKIVYQDLLPAGTERNLKTIDLTGQPGGIYFAGVWQNGKKLNTQKIIKY
jgi:photosystem II stability/assembly factor-like uncharacterized protein